MTRRISPASFLPDAFFCSKQKNKTTSLRMWFCGAEGGIISQACGREMRPHGIAVSDSGAKNSPPDCFLHAPHPLRVRIPQKQKTRTPDGVLVFWRRRGDSNPRTVLPAYSLSRGAPYSHLGTSAWLQVVSGYGGEKGGGESGIRTHGSCESPVFKTGSLNHSDISPHRFQSEAMFIVPYSHRYVNIQNQKVFH